MVLALGGRLDLRTRIAAVKADARKNPKELMRSIWINVGSGQFFHFNHKFFVSVLVRDLSHPSSYFSISAGFGLSFIACPSLKARSV